MQKLGRIESSIKNYVNARDPLNALLNATPEARDPLARGTLPLSRISIAVKDNICTSNLPTTCASEGLKNYQSPYEASVVLHLRQAGATIMGKANLDEFGMGSHSTNSAFGPVYTPDGHSAGGSSGGSAVAVATNQRHAALGTDTGGSVRLPAAYNGVFGFKPSYGLLSRRGVVAYANTLDTVGLIARSPETLRKIFDQVNIHDPADPTSLTSTSRFKISKVIENRPSSTKFHFGVPKECLMEELSNDVRGTWAELLHHLHYQGHRISIISLPLTKQALSAYYILAPAEASSNLAKYDNVRYGQKPAKDTNDTSDLLFSNARRNGFGDEVRRRILLGTYTLSAEAMDSYFIQAQKIRRLLQEDFDRVFALPHPLQGPSEPTDQDGPKRYGIDAIICPTAPTAPPTLDDALKQSHLDASTNDVFTVPANLAGLPAVTIPFSKVGPSGERSNIGLQVITQYGDDALALSTALLLQEASKEM